MLFALVVTGCAQAHRDGFNQRPDSGVHLTDSSTGGNQDTGGGGMIDAPPHIDSPTGGGTQTLSQTTSNTDTQIGIACGNSTAGTTAKNSYYRVFTLSDYGVTGTFHVQAVDFGVSSATGSPPLKVSVGTYSGTAGGATLTGTITLLASANINPASTDTSEHVPLVADVTGNLVVEIDQTTAGTTTNGYQFYIAANASGETKPGYILATDCSVSTPTSMTQAAGTETDMVITVTGST